MKLLYKPVGIVLGIVAGLISRKLFERLWALIDREDPPKPTTRETTWPKVLAAAAASTFGQVVCCVVGLGGSSRSISAHRRSKSLREMNPARMPSRMPNGLYSSFMVSSLPVGFSTGCRWIPAERGVIMYPNSTDEHA